MSGFIANPIDTNSPGATFLPIFFDIYSITKGVSMKEGHKQLTLMFYSFSNHEMDLENPTTPCLLAE